jgi:hypothetical protein
MAQERLCHCKGDPRLSVAEYKYIYYYAGRGDESFKIYIREIRNTPGRGDESFKKKLKGPYQGGQVYIIKLSSKTKVKIIERPCMPEDC